MDIEKRLKDFEARLKESGRSFDGAEGRYAFDIEGSGVYQLVIEDGQASLAAEEDGDPDVTLSMSLATFEGVIDGSVNAAQAFMQGKLKLDGDMGKAMKLQNLLSS